MADKSELDSKPTAAAPNGFLEIPLNDVSGHHGNKALERPKGLKLVMPDIIDTTVKKSGSGKGGRKGSYTLDHTVDDPMASRQRTKISDTGYMRHIVAVLALSSIVLANTNRQAYNQSLSSMVKSSSSKDGGDNNSTQASTVQLPVQTTTSVIPEYYTPIEPQPAEGVGGSADLAASNDDDDDDVFYWDQNRVSLLQSAFSFGYTPFMIPGGRLCEIYGAKWIVFLSGFGSALCSALVPFLADSNFYLLVASRVLMGICQTGVSPALYALLTRWLPAQESNVYLPMLKVGVMIGLWLGSTVSGFFHWRTTFYLVALISFLWSILWLIFISSDPNEHKFISRRELQYIQAEIERNNMGRKMSVGSARRRTAPWFNILTNPVVVSFMFAKFTVKLSTDAQAIQMPKYLHDVFHVSKELNGMLNSLNFAIQAIFTGFIAWAAQDFIQRTLYGLNKTQVRRLFQGISNFGMALSFIIISFNMSSLSVVCFGIVLLSITSMFGAGGEAMTPVDLSTEYSASIMAIANCVANISGIVLPPLVSSILGGQTTSSVHWNMVWWAVAAIIASGGLTYSCFVEAELQNFRPDEPGHDNRKRSSTNVSNEKDLTNGIELKVKS